MAWRSVVGMAAALSCLVANLGVSASLREAPEELDDGLRVVSPVEAGLDTALIATVLRQLADGAYPGVHSFLLLVNDQLVIERYYEGHERGTLHEIRSATKSLGSILVGLALDRGSLPGLSTAVAPYFRDEYEPDTGWDPRVFRVTLGQLLTMTSGFDCDDLATNFGCETPMYQADDWVAYALGLPMAFEPGEHWAYNSSSLILAGQMIALAEEQPLTDFAREHLFDPLGVEEYRWTVSPRGHAWIGGGARMRPRDMMKIGLLMLNEGMWQDRRVVSRDWVITSTAPAVDMFNGVTYAHLWQTSPAYVGKHRIEAFWASGNGGQYIVVLPSLDAVAVFTGGNYDDPLASQPIRLLHELIVPAIVQPEAESILHLEAAALERRTGTYALGFAPVAKLHVRRKDRGLLMRTPDDEDVLLMPYERHRFGGDSSYGKLTVIFSDPDGDGPAEAVVYGAFSRFRFVADGSP